MSKNKINQMIRDIALSLLIGLAWGQSADSFIVDETLFDSGNLKHQRFYKDGKANGKWTHYYKNGNIWIEGNYNDGIQVGLWTIYYKNGPEWTKGNCKNNEKSGELIFYNETGTVYEEKKYSP